MYRLTLAVCLVLAALPGCERGVVKVAPAESPAVPIARPVQREVTDYIDYTGSTRAKDSVIIQPRVTGILVNMPFEEGNEVNKGDILFEIDPRPYEAQLSAAKAAVAQNIAALTYAKETNLQFKDIAKKSKDAVTLRELNQYKALEEQAEAALNFAKANLVSAELNLGYTVVRSPIDGRISRYYLTKGNLVNQDVTQLTTVVSMDPMYVYFDMDEPTLQRIKHAMNEGRISPPRMTKSALPALAASTVGLRGSQLAPADLLTAFATLVGNDAPVSMGLQGEEGHPHQGFINFIDNQVNPGTGSISVRGVFSNPRSVSGTYLLTPGMFVRVRLPIGAPQKKLLVIDRAVTSDQGLKYLYVLGADNKIESRRVSVGALQEDGLRVITGEGLNEDDWVVVGAMQQVRPGMTVATKDRQELEKMPSLGEPAVPVDGVQKKGKK